MTGVFQPDHLDQLLGALAAFLRVDVKEAAKKIDRLVGVEVAVKVRFLRQITDARLGLHVARRVVEHRDAAACRVQQAKQHLHRGGLAGAVRAQQSEHLAALDLEVDALDGARLGPAPEILEHFGQPLR